MALSFYNMSTTTNELQQDLQFLLEAPPPDLFSLEYNSAFNIEPFVDPIFETNDLGYANLLPYFSSPSDHSLISLSPEIFPSDQDFESYYQIPKHQKIDFSPKFKKNEFSPKFLGGYNSPVPEIPPMKEFKAPVMTFSHGRTESTNAKKQSGVSLSAQSIAARQRRRKISEKTQELGKLVPGGHKMNTGEMFQAAYKYIKFLQAQVGILESFCQTDNDQEENEALETPPHLPILLASPIIQEKLYSEEKCLVPKKIVESLASDCAILSNPSNFNGIDHLLLDS